MVTPWLSLEMRVFTLALKSLRLIVALPLMDETPALEKMVAAVNPPRSSVLSPPLQLMEGLPEQLKGVSARHATVRTLPRVPTVPRRTVSPLPVMSERVPLAFWR